MGLPCAGPVCPSFGQTVLGPFSRLRDGCRVARLRFLLAFSTGHPPFVVLSTLFSVPVGTPGRGLPLFSSNFSVLNLRTLFFLSFNPADPSFFRLTPVFFHVQPMFFRLLFPDPSVFAFLAPPWVFSRPAPFFFPPARVFSPVLFCVLCFFSRPVRFPLAFSRVSRPSLRLPCGASGSSARSFAPTARPRGFDSPRPRVFSSRHFLRLRSLQELLPPPGLPSASLVQAKQTT